MGAGRCAAAGRLGAAPGRARLRLGRRGHAGAGRRVPRPLLDRGRLSLARGARDPGGVVRLRPDRRRRTHAQPRRSRRPGAGRRRRRLALRRVVLGGRALRHDLQGRGRRRRRGADRLRDRRLAAPRHLRRGPRLRRRLREPRDHRQRDAQHAGPVRLSAGDRRRHAGRHPPARLVAARLGRAGGIGDLDAALDVRRWRDGLHWVGLFLVAVAGLFVWATWRRMGESENPPTTSRRWSGRRSASPAC